MWWPLAREVTGAWLEERAVGGAHEVREVGGRAALSCDPTPLLLGTIQLPGAAQGTCCIFSFTVLLTWGHVAVSGMCFDFHTWMRGCSWHLVG